MAARVPEAAAARRFADPQNLFHIAASPRSRRAGISDLRSCFAACAVSAKTIVLRWRSTSDFHHKRKLSKRAPPVRKPAIVSYFADLKTFTAKEEKGDDSLIFESIVR